jgi:hypothetical protein
MTSYVMFVGFGSNKKRRKGFSVVWLAFIWAVWKCRNDRIFNNKAAIEEEVVDYIQRLSWQWYLHFTMLRKARVFFMSGCGIRGNVCWDDDPLLLAFCPALLCFVMLLRCVCCCPALLCVFACCCMCFSATATLLVCCVFWFYLGLFWCWYLYL